MISDINVTFFQLIKIFEFNFTRISFIIVIFQMIINKQSKKKGGVNDLEIFKEGREDGKKR